MTTAWALFVCCDLILPWMRDWVCTLDLGQTELWILLFQWMMMNITSFWGKNEVIPTNFLFLWHLKEWELDTCCCYHMAQFHFHASNLPDLVVINPADLILLERRSWNPFISLSFFAGIHRHVKMHSYFAAVLQMVKTGELVICLRYCLLDANCPKFVGLLAADLYLILPNCPAHVTINLHISYFQDGLSDWLAVCIEIERIVWMSNEVPLDALKRCNKWSKNRDLIMEYARLENMHCLDQ